MTAEAIGYTIVRSSAIVAAWMANYAVQSTALFLIVLLITRRIASHDARETIWKGALFGSVVIAVVRTIGFEPGIWTPFDISTLVETRQWRYSGLTGSADAVLRIVPVILVLAWLAFALITLARVAAADRRARAALDPRSDVDDPSVMNRFESLSRALGLKRRVRLTLSPAMTSPVALGNSEICVPERFRTDLTPDEQDSVLAHEIAHIVRRDPWWLLAAVTLESIFFFQPLNRLVRMKIQDEAEYLADDLAVSRVSSGVTLARCLARVAEWIGRDQNRLLAPALVEEKSSLLRRVSRLLEKPQPAPSAASRAGRLAGAGIVLAGVLILTPGFTPGGARVWGTPAFQWQGNVRPGQTVEIRGVMGGIHAEPWNGNTVMVSATRHGRRTSPDVRFETIAHDGGITVCALYPVPAGQQPNRCAPGGAGRELNTKANDVEIEFLVRLPAGVGFTGHSATGDVTTGLLSGPISAHSSSGDIKVATTSYAGASSASGNVNVTMGETSWSDTLSIGTLSGNLTVRLPPAASTEVDASSRVGKVRSDFPLAGETLGFWRRFALRGSLGEHARGTIGRGGRFLELTSTAGSIAIKRAK